MEVNSVSLLHWLTRYLVDQDKYHIELNVQCLSLNPDDRPSSRVIGSILECEAEFADVKISVGLFSAQSFEFLNGRGHEQLIFPGVVKKIFNKFSFYSSTATEWMAELRDCIVSPDS